MNTKPRSTSELTLSHTFPDIVEPSHIIFDLASLRFKLYANTVTATTSNGEKLGVAQVGLNGTREACLEALDDAASRARIWRNGKMLQVAFYNPHTAEVSLGPSYQGYTYKFNTPILLNLSGVLAQHQGNNFVTVAQDVAIVQSQPSVRELLRRLTSIRAAN